MSATVAPSRAIGGGKIVLRARLRSALPGRHMQDDPAAATPAGSAWAAAVTAVDTAGEVVEVTLTTASAAVPLPEAVVLIEATFCESIDPPKGC